MTRPITIRAALWLVAALTLFGFALRVYDLNRVPLRGDEAFTMIHWVRSPLMDTLNRIATIDPQPPLAYAVYHLWGQWVGQDEHTIRFLPALINTLGIPALYALGKRLGGQRVGLLAALLWALHPAQIWHAQDARNYALWGAASPIALWLALRALDRQRPVDWILYISAAGITAYLYYLELFVIAALNGVVLLTRWRDRGLLIRWIGAQIVIAAALAVWFLQERLLFGSGYGGTAGTFEPLRLLTWFLPSLTFGETLPADWMTALALPIVIGCTAALIGLSRCDTRSALLLGALLVLPLIGIAIVSTRLNVFVPRYVLSASLPIILLISYAIVMLDRVLRPTGVVLLGAVVLVSLISLNNHYFRSDYAKSPRWDALTEYLAQSAAPTDIILNTSADIAYAFYHQQAGVPASFEDLPAQPRETAASIQGRLNAITGGIWIVADTAADWPNRGAVEAWLVTERQPIVQTRIAGMRAEYWLPFPTPPTELPLAEFDGAAELLSAAVLPPPGPGGDLTVYALWRPLAQTSSDLKIFVHGLGEAPTPAGSPLWTQDDQFPGDGAYSSRTWQPDAVFRDIYRLPTAGLPSGTYQIAIGLYDAVTGTRIRTSTGADVVQPLQFTLP